MAFFRIFPSKDVSIASGDPAAGVTRDISGSNVGAAEVLNLYRTVDEMNSQANILVQFDLSQIPAAAPLTASEFWLKMFDAQHTEAVPTDFDAVVYPASRSWQEGAGLDMDFYTDSGWANWLSATVTSAWSVPGGDFVTTPSLTAVAHFYSGHEAMEVNVSATVANWLVSGSNYGFFIRIDPALTATDYYIKKFHSRQTHFPTRRPHLEVRWDDRTTSLSTTQSFVVVDAASPWFGYAVDPRLSGTISGSWVTSTLAVVDPTGALVASLPSLKPVYDAIEVPRLDLQVQVKDWNPATAATGSFGTPNVVLTKVHYRITDAVTDEVLVPFATGSAVPYTRLGYTDSGSFFKLYMSSLPTGSLLQIDFLYEAPTGSGNWALIPGTTNRFRVISHG